MTAFTHEGMFVWLWLRAERAGRAVQLHMGADMELRTAAGLTALQVAKAKGNAECVRALEEHAAAQRAAEKAAKEAARAAEAAERAAERAVAEAEAARHAV